MDSYLCDSPYWICICRSFSFHLYIYGRRVFKWILKFVLVISLVFAASFNVTKAPGRLHWSLWKWDVASVFFNVHTVTKFPLPSVLLWNYTNLPCLVNLSLRWAPMHFLLFLTFPLMCNTAVCACTGSAKLKNTRSTPKGAAALKQKTAAWNFRL